MFCYNGIDMMRQRTLATAAFPQKRYRSISNRKQRFQGSNWIFCRPQYYFPVQLARLIELNGIIFTPNLVTKSITHHKNYYEVDTNFS